MGDKSEQYGVLLDTAIAADQLAGVSRAARRAAERDNKKKSKSASGASGSGPSSSWFGRYGK